MINQSFFLFVLFLGLSVGIPYPDNSGNDFAAIFKQVTDVAKVAVYYESLCPDCIAEYSRIVQLLEKLQRSVNLVTYPYGNARMYNVNGKIVVQCQHGEAECYGNKLHACAMDRLHLDPFAYVPFIGCMMPKHSNDAAIDTCAQSQRIDSEAIKTCARGKRGQDLLVYYGKISEQISYPGVPYVVINGKPKPDEEDLLHAVCQVLKNPPDACNEIVNSSESESDSLSFET